jgi:hypothetical protein
MSDTVEFDEEALQQLVESASDAELQALEIVAFEAIEREEGSDDDGTD